LSVKETLEQVGIKYFLLDVGPLCDVIQKVCLKLPYRRLVKYVGLYHKISDENSK